MIFHEEKVIVLVTLEDNPLHHNVGGEQVCEVVLQGAAGFIHYTLFLITLSLYSQNQRQQTNKSSIWP